MIETINEPLLYTDTETWNTVDIKTAGTVKYADSVEMLLAGFLLEDRYEYYDYHHKPEIPQWVHDHVDSGGKVVAHNMLFDFVVLQKHLPNLKIEQCIDTMAVCGMYGLPLALGKATKVLNLPAQKYDDGGRLVRRFCIPRKASKLDKRTRITAEDDPKQWEEFRDVYLNLDIYSMRDMVNKIGVLPPEQQRDWVNTQKINLIGVPIDVETCKLIQGKIFQLVDEESSKFIRLTSLYPTQRDRVLGWVRDMGVRITNLQAATVQDVLADKDTPDIVRDALTARANVSHMSFKKYDAFLNAAMEDDRARGAHMYHAAHTGRYGGRLIQTQNLTKGTIDTNEAVQAILDGEFSVELVKSSVRGMIAHPDGFTIVDYSGIEARIVQWIAGDLDAIQIFLDGKDPYVWMAAKIYGVDEDEVDSKQRFTGKQAILGLGYQMSWKKFIMMIEGYGETLSIDEAKLAVTIYRATHSKLVALWARMNQCALEALHRPMTGIKVNKHIAFYYDNKDAPFLHMRLPSGRYISYYQPSPEENDWGSQTFSYMSMNDKHQYVRTRTYGGKLVENAVQGIAADVLNHGVDKLLEYGHEVVTHVHDETVTVGMGKEEEIQHLMCHLPDWAEGCPIEAEGFSSPRFRKD
jgi:DNA polymerase